MIKIQKTPHYFHLFSFHPKHVLYRLLFSRTKLGPFSIPTSRTSMLRMMPCCRVSLAVEPRDPQSNCRLWGWKCCWCFELQASWMCRIPIEFFWGWCCDGTWLFSKKAPLKQKHLGMLPDLLRLCFPAVVANASPLTVLPQFVEVLGKKLDKISAELDRTCYNVSCSW